MFTKRIAFLFSRLSWYKHTGDNSFPYDTQEGETLKNQKEQSII